MSPSYRTSICTKRKRSTSVVDVNEASQPCHYLDTRAQLKSFCLAKDFNDCRQATNRWRQSDATSDPVNCRTYIYVCVCVSANGGKDRLNQQNAAGRG